MKTSDYRAVKITNDVGTATTIICEARLFDNVLTSAKKLGKVEEVAVTEEMLRNAEIIIE